MKLDFVNKTSFRNILGNVGMQLSI